MFQDYQNEDMAWELGVLAKTRPLGWEEALGCEGGQDGLQPDWEAGKQMLYGTPLSSPGLRWPQSRLPVPRAEVEASQEVTPTQTTVSVLVQEHSLSSTVTGGVCTRMHVTRLLCASEGELGDKEHEREVPILPFTATLWFCLLS